MSAGAAARTPRGGIQPERRKASTASTGGGCRAPREGRGRDAGDVLLDGPLGHDQAVRDRLVGEPLGHQPEHLALAGRQVGQPVLTAPAADELRDDARVEGAAPAGDAAGGVGQLVTRRDAVLEQVADALRRLGQQVHRVVGLDVVREHQHPGPWVLPPDAPRRLQPSSLWVGGMRMSTMARSGSCSRTQRIRWGTSPTRPTTSNSASSRMLAMPSRTITTYPR